MTVPYFSLDREVLAARLTALINWTLRVSESYDHVMSRIQRLEASQKQQEVQANHEHQLMRIIELFMQDDVRACTVMDYIIVFFRLLLAKLRQEGQDFDDVRQLNKALSDEEVSQIFRAVLSKLGFPASEQGAILVVLEAMQPRRWPKSQVMTTSPGGDAQISSALLYLRLQRDLEPVMSSALQRALCAAHECILTDLAISEATAQDVNINASDIRKDDAYVDARVKYEDYASFDRHLPKAGGLVHEGVPESLEDLKDPEAAMLRSCVEDSERSKNRRIQCERVASTSVAIEHTSSLESACSLENSFSAEETASEEQSPRDALPSCRPSEKETSTASLPADRRQTARMDTTTTQETGSVPDTEPADTDSARACNDGTEHPAPDDNNDNNHKHRDMSHNARTEETDRELDAAAENRDGTTEKPAPENYHNDAPDDGAGIGLREGEPPRQELGENRNQSSAADEMGSPVSIDRARLVPDPSLYVLCYDVPSSPARCYPSPGAVAAEEWQKAGGPRAERRHRPGCLAPRRSHGKSSSAEDWKTG